MSLDDCSFKIPVLGVAKCLMEESILQFTAAGFDLGNFFSLAIFSSFLRSSLESQNHDLTGIFLMKNCSLSAESDLLAKPDFTVAGKLVTNFCFLSRRLFNLFFWKIYGFFYQGEILSHTLHHILPWLGAFETGLTYWICQAKRHFLILTKFKEALERSRDCLRMTTILKDFLML